MIKHVLALATVSLLAVKPVAADNVELRIATLAPAGSPWMAVLDKSAAEIKEKTAGRVTLKYFEGGQQGDERDFVRKIKLGQLDGAAVTAIGLSMIDESIRVLEVPMMFANVEEVDYVADKMWPYFQKKFEKKGFQLGDAGDVGWVYFLSKDKVETLADLKAQKVWRWSDDDVVKAMYKKLGVTKDVSLGVPEVDGNLTSGKINACYGPPLAAMTLGWASKVKYMTSMPMAYSIGATVIKLDTLKKIDAEDLKKIQKITKTISKSLMKAVRKDNEASLKQMKQKGIKVTETPADMVSDFTKAAEKVWDELAGSTYSKKELADVKKWRKKYRDSH